MSKDVECPYCGVEQEICHDDNYGYDEGELHQQICPECERTFAYETSTIVSHEAFAAPCIDGEEEHKKSNFQIFRDVQQAENSKTHTTKNSNAIFRIY